MIMTKTKENSKIETKTDVSDTIMKCSYKVILTMGLIIGIVSISSLVVATATTGGLLPMIVLMISVL